MFYKLQRNVDVTNVYSILKNCNVSITFYKNLITYRHIHTYCKFHIETEIPSCKLILECMSLYNKFILLMSTLLMPVKSKGLKFFFIIKIITRSHIKYVCIIITILYNVASYTRTHVFA